MKPISPYKWWRVAQTGYNPPVVTIYEKSGIVHFCESTFAGNHIYTRITTGDNQYCVRVHRDEWRKQL